MKRQPLCVCVHTHTCLCFIILVTCELSISYEHHILCNISCIWNCRRKLMIYGYIIDDSSENLIKQTFVIFCGSSPLIKFNQASFHNLFFHSKVAWYYICSCLEECLYSDISNTYISNMAALLGCITLLVFLEVIYI